MVEMDSKNGKPEHIPEKITIPRRFLRRNVIYRSLGEIDTKSLGCGSIPKAGPHIPQIRFAFDNFCAVYLLRGDGRYRDPDLGLDCPLRAGDLVLRPPRREHFTIPGESGQWLEFFMIGPRTIHELLCAQRIITPANPILHPGLDARLIRVCRKIHQRIMKGRPVDLQHAILDMQHFVVHAAILERQSGTDRQNNLKKDVQRKIHEACRLLQNNLAHPLNIEAIAEYLDIPFETFRKQFRAITGISPGRYRNQKRLERAKYLLFNTDLPVTTIAQRCGYRDLYTFSRQFKRYTGLAPSRFRADFL